jgi:hypothetical protein
MKPDNACCHYVQNLVSCSILSKNIKIKIKRIVIFCFLLYIWENSSLPLREGRKLWVFENKVLRIMFGPKKDEVTGEWRKQHSKELLYLCICVYNYHFNLAARLCWMIKAMPWILYHRRRDPFLFYSCLVKLQCRSLLV